MDLKQIEGKVIVSCQALEHEPLFGADIMAAMARAAEAGGAAAIRANTPVDIAAIRRNTRLPIIGLLKRDYEHSPVYITPTMEEVRAVAEAGADMVAFDATDRERPDGVPLAAFIAGIRGEFPDLLLLADISTFEEGARAMELGVDAVSTTLSGYTPYSKQQSGPDVELVRLLAELARTPVIAEGRIWTPEQCRICLDAGAFAVVVGTAITRPQEITRRFVSLATGERR
ncbi:N-acetylmannosamine-6-phosphate 2-epimerase [Paenibacillaceae bacterium WGS1546]|uniref:N-acetylmannosamine-6-phosphate 2-epimerase n=1 Tax=Cohnella sp. WGS1546 TaxID=3366810 RepID=UPI00372D5263